MSRLPRQLCHACGQPLPKEPTPTPSDGTAEAVRRVREATERRNAEGSTGIRDALEGGALAAEKKQGRRI